jgi:hypothetical protein
MVPANAHGADLLQPGHDAIGLRSIADHVAELPDGVDRTQVGEHGIEGDQVAVDVREDRDPHRREG